MQTTNSCKTVKKTLVKKERGTRCLKVKSNKKARRRRAGVKKREGEE
jgi:hypothetical protein